MTRALISGVVGLAVVAGLAAESASAGTFVSVNVSVGGWGGSYGSTCFVPYPDYSYYGYSCRPVYYYRECYSGWGGYSVPYICEPRHHHSTYVRRVYSSPSWGSPRYERCMPRYRSCDR